MPGDGPSGSGSGSGSGSLQLRVQRDLRQFATETTAHGIGRLVGARPLYLKCLWALAFVALAALFGKYFAEAIEKYNKREQNTAYYTDKVEFIFPDVYICPTNPISGSYSVSLNATEAADMRARIQQLISQFEPYTNNNSFLLSKVVINSLPFSLMADMFGHRQVQMFIQASIAGTVPLNEDGNDESVSAQEFYYPDLLRCAKLLLTEANREALKNPGNFIQAFLLADAHILQFPAVVTNQVVIRGVMSGVKLDVIAPLWSYSTGWDAFSSSSLRLFLTEPGTYPTLLSSSSILLKPGTSNEVVISMLQVNKESSDLAGECVSGDEGRRLVKFHNPYNESFPYEHRYSYDFCYYEEIFRATQALLNCTNVNYPRPEQFASVKNCYNWSATGIYAFPNASRTASVSRNAADACAKQYPCRMRTYSMATSAGEWPLDTDNRLLLNMIRSAPVLTSSDTKPLFNYVFSVLDSIGPNASVAQLETLNRLLRSQLLQVTLRSAGQLSTEMKVTLAYSSASLFAETGGFLGLYLGCSVLTIGEVLELLHDLLGSAWFGWMPPTEDSRKEEEGPAGVPGASTEGPAGIPDAGRITLDDI